MVRTERLFPARRFALPAAGLALGAATFLLAAGWSGPEGGHRAVPALAALLYGGSLALLWLVMAAGFGGWIADRLFGPFSQEEERDEGRFALECALGIAAALCLDLLLGSLGWLTALQGGVAWSIIAGGCALFILRWRRSGIPWPMRARDHGELGRPALALAIPTAVLLLAAASEPGWLWASEFGGYDALSYHLQLPKEWLALGRIETLPHNVYSGLPSAVEAAYLHLFLIGGGPESAAIAAQYLSVGATLIAALTVGGLARRWTGPATALPATALYLGTPWVTVVGSLAYNDGFVPLFLAAALLFIERERRMLPLGLGLGLFFAAAFGAKPTAAGFAILPAIAVLFLVRGRAGFAPFALAGALSTALLSPWLIRNGLAAGNPLHPFASSLFTSAWWTPEQATIFAQGHASDLDLFARLRRLLGQVFFFGFGVNPNPGQPWIPLWSLLPLIGLLGFVRLCIGRRTRRAALFLGVVLFIQCFFWLGWTHLQSRFLLPAAVPLAIAAASLVRALATLAGDSALRRRGIATALLVGWSILPLWIFRHERPIDVGEGRVIRAPAALIGGADLATGDAFAAKLAQTTDLDQRMELLESAPVALFVNHLLPADARILLVGEARLFHLRGAVPERITYNTVWDRGPLDRIAEEHPDQPERWSAELRALGYRYVIVDIEMLERWKLSGWLNPSLSPERMGRFVETTRILHRFRSRTGIRALLLELEPPR